MVNAHLCPTGGVAGQEERRLNDEIFLEEAGQNAGRAEKSIASSRSSKSRLLDPTGEWGGWRNEMTVIHIADEWAQAPLDGSGRPVTFGAQRSRKSPYFGATLRYGAKAFSVCNRTCRFGKGPEADFQALIDRGVTVWDVSVQRQVEIVGPDAGAFMARVSPRDLSKMLPGRARYVLFTDDQGGVLNDPVVLKLAEDRFWLSLADSDLLLWMRGLNAAWGLDVQIREPDVSPIQIQGRSRPR